MNKLAFFLKFYRTQKLRFLLMVFIFAFAGAILSCTLFIHSNNQVYFQAQMQKAEEKYIIAEGIENSENNLIFDTMEKVMTVFSLGSILIVVWGCTSILFFQNISMQKSYAMLRIFGMSKSDVFVKALVEGLSFGLPGSCIGGAGGYALFRHLSKKLCNIENFVSGISTGMLLSLLAVVVLLIVIAFFGSFISGLFIYETPVITMLNGRKGGKRKTSWFRFAVLEFVLLYLIMSVLFWKNQSYVTVTIFICGMVLALLSGVFYIIFGRQVGKRNSGKKNMDKIADISFRFLCTRNRRDAFLAATVSVGAIIICFVLNIIFNFSGILRDAYRDNLGISTAVWRQNSLDEDRKIENILNEKGYFYTKAFSKKVLLSELQGQFSEEEFFYAFVADKQTDGNERFMVPKGTFMAVRSVARSCGLKPGVKSDILGRELTYTKNFPDNMWMSLVTYHLMVNREDWGLKLDDTWNTVFLLDLDRGEEKELESVLDGEPCEMTTASQLSDALVELLSDYLSVVAVTGIMLILVTGVFFYSMVRTDLLARKRELYLYQIYGASRKQAFFVVYLEYLMIAWFASFSVVLVTMVLGEIMFSSMLDRHYPLSIPVVLVTSLVSTLFVLVCCMAAQWMNFMSSKMEIIRDE